MYIYIAGHYSSGLTGGTVTVTLDTIQNTTSIETETTFHSSYLSNTIIKNDNYYDDSIKILQNNNQNINNDNNITTPMSVNVTSCQTNLEVPKNGGIKFTGSLSAKFIGLFSSSIAKHVTDALDSEICPNIKLGIDEQLNDMLKKMNEYLRGLIYGNDNTTTISTSTTSSSIAVSASLPSRNRVDVINYATSNDTNSLISWQSDLIIMKGILTKFNNFLASHMDKGLILSFLDWIGWSSNSGGDDDDESNENQKCNSTTDCGLFFRGVNGIIRSLVDSGFVNITKEFKQFAYEIEKVGNFNMTLYNSEIGGLDTLTKIEVLPKYNHTLSLGLESKYGFQGKFMVDLNVNPITDGSADVIIQGATLHESFYVLFNISSVTLDVDLDLGVVKDKLKGMTMGDLADSFSSSNRNNTINLLLSTLAYANVTELSPSIQINSIELIPLSRGDQSTHRNETLETSLDDTINHIILLLLNEYDLLWSKSIVAIAQGPVRKKLNSALENLLSNILSSNEEAKKWRRNEGVLSDYEDDRKFFNFSSSDVIHKIHDAFASEEWISVFNQFLACVTTFIEKKIHGIQAPSTNQTNFDISIHDASISNVDNINRIGKRELAFENIYYVRNPS